MAQTTITISTITTAVEAAHRREDSQQSNLKMSTYKVTQYFNSASSFSSFKITSSHAEKMSLT
ncbi:CLUMA_CG018750, isoform A [Clunio marinus]|uniref:CLUMA_CG018750, isoform A n=1 Tax=Clunio marinus TaxID=568069 RepID=A0A1J1J065_9DIPT|nr:CLUMA_CG018750, isoform A [Clunio marinus]